MAMKTKTQRIEALVFLGFSPEAATKHIYRSFVTCKTKGIRPKYTQLERTLQWVQNNPFGRYYKNADVWVRYLGKNFNKSGLAESSLAHVLGPNIKHLEHAIASGKLRFPRGYLQHIGVKHTIYTSRRRGGMDQAEKEKEISLVTEDTSDGPVTPVTPPTSEETLTQRQLLAFAAQVERISPVPKAFYAIVKLAFAFYHKKEL